MQRQVNVNPKISTYNVDKEDPFKDIYLKMIYFCLNRKHQKTLFCLTSIPRVHSILSKIYIYKSLINRLTTLLLFQFIIYVHPFPLFSFIPLGWYLSLMYPEKNTTTILRRLLYERIWFLLKTPFCLGTKNIFFYKNE